jgi:UDP-N-acetylmuramoyl-tripeptide--D-alanyl-D-alanine ligase
MWNWLDAARATGGKTGGGWPASGLSIDTRSLQPGEMFVALKDARDGHDFVSDALAKGASAAMVSRVPHGVAADDPRLLIVPDVLAGLQDLARAARTRTQAQVVGVTGSVGKTSTKDMLAHCLAAQGKTHAAQASYNNHWGVPLTLARMPQDADFAVIEIGMSNPGEIAPLAQLADLDVAMITTIAPAHLAAFGALSGIAYEKASIMDGLRQSGVAVLPLGAPLAPDLSRILLDKARLRDLRALTFGADPAADYVLKRASTSAGATVVQAHARGQPMLFKLPVLGAHFAANALGVMTVIDALGLDRMLALTALGRWSPPAGRGTRQTIVLDAVEGLQFDLLDDAFNANPASMAAALDVLAASPVQNHVGRLGQGRRIAVLGDMLELGAGEAAMHTALADHPALAQIDLVHCVGPRMQALWQALPRGKRGEWVDSAETLAARARALVDAGDVILVKSSKGTKCALIVDALRKLGQSAPPDAKGET